MCSTEPFDTPGVSEALPRLFLSVTCLARADKKLLAFASLSSERQNSRYLRAAGRTQAAQRSLQFNGRPWDGEHVPEIVGGVVAGPGRRLPSAEDALHGPESSGRPP